MARIIGLAIRLCGLAALGGLAGLLGFGMGGPLGAALLFALGGFIGFFTAPLIWHRITRSHGGQ